MHISKRLLAIIGILALTLTMGSAAITLGAEVIITGTVDEVTTLTTSGGDPYTRLLVKFERELGGSAYPVILPVMGFGSLAAPAAEKVQGDKIRAIAQKRMYEGRESYVIIQFEE